MRAYEGLIRAATRDEIATWPPAPPSARSSACRPSPCASSCKRSSASPTDPRSQRLAASLRRLMTWTTDMRRGLVFAFLGPDRLTALRGFHASAPRSTASSGAEITARRDATDLASRPDILSLLLTARDR